MSVPTALSTLMIIRLNDRRPEGWRAEGCRSLMCNQSKGALGGVEFWHWVLGFLDPFLALACWRGVVVVGLELFVWAGISRYISLLHFLTILFLVFLKCPFCSKSTVADVTFECLVF